MNIKHSNSVDSKMIIDKFTVDFYGDHLLIVGFRFMPVRSPFETEKYDTGTFTGNFSIN